jgi:hypothetical protein
VIVGVAAYAVLPKMVARTKATMIALTFFMLSLFLIGWLG